MQSHPFRSMLWKETRELLPLAAAITIGSTAIQFIIALFSSGVTADTLTGLLAATPSALCAAFVVAAGSIMFAGEKESETIDFLRRLPTSPGLVTRSKISAAILTSLLLASTLTPITLTLVYWKGLFELLQIPWEDWGSWKMTLSTLFVVFIFCNLLIWGMFFSIISGKVLWSIFLTILASFVALNTYLYSPAILLIALLIVYALKTRWFYDRPLFSGVFPTISVSVSLPRMNVSFPTADDSRRPPRSRAALRLRWLEWQRSWGFLVCILIASLLWSITLIGSEFLLKPRMIPDLYQNAVVGPVVVIPFYLLNLALLIAGISTFSFDQQNQCYRFFSERGLSPAALFWNKLLIWGSVGLVLPVVLSLGIELIYTTQTNRWQALGPDPFLLVGVIVLVCSISFTSGLLASLISKSMYVAFGLGLIFLITSLIWNIFVAGDSNGISWSLLPVPLIFLLAARTRVPDWLLERNRVRHWLKLYTVLFIPLSICAASVPLYRVYSIPRSPPLNYSKESTTFASLPKETRLFATRTAIELHCLGYSKSPENAIFKLITPVLHPDAYNPFGEWYFSLSPAEKGWQHAGVEERNWVEQHRSWLNNSMVLDSEASAIQSDPLLVSSQLNSIFRNPHQLLQLVYLHHLEGSRLASEGHLEASLQHHLQAIRIAALRWRISPNPLSYRYPDTQTITFRQLQESELITAWSLRWLHSWTLNPNQTRETLAAAIPQLEQSFKDLASPSQACQLLAQSFEHSVENTDYGSPWENERKRRISTIIARREVNDGFLADRQLVKGQESHRSNHHSEWQQVINLPRNDPFNNESHQLHFITNNPLRTELHQLSRELSLTCQQSTIFYRWRLIAFQSLELAMALNAWRIEHGSFPTTLQPLVGPYFDEIPRFNLGDRSSRFTSHPFTYLPAGLQDDLTLLTSPSQAPDDIRPVRSLPHNTPFIFFSSEGAPAFIPYQQGSYKGLKIDPPRQWQLNPSKPDLLFGHSSFILLPLVPTDLIQVPEPEQQTLTSPQTKIIPKVISGYYPEGVDMGSKSLAAPPPPSAPTNNKSSNAINATPD